MAITALTLVVMACTAEPALPTLAPTEAPTLAPTPSIPTTHTSEPAHTPEPTPTILPTPTLTPVGEWWGLTIAPEERCSPYVAGDYRYPQAVEDLVVAELGGVYSPYTDEWFSSTKDTDIEHIVARSEAHDSGLCATDVRAREKFARDLLNLTLASPPVNRNQKSDKDAAEWLPNHNRCWFAERVVQVRQKYGLTIDRSEFDALVAVLSGCASTDLVFSGQPVEAATQPPPTYTRAWTTRIPPPTLRPTPTPQPAPSGGDPLSLYDNNGNGRITCAEARSHGIAPVHRGHPAYRFMDDRDNDGIVCE